ncbi:MAG: sulfurtransferase-like selenium metabolism protein YedF [Promicromonosporaceae bacterium]|nr:sulfurtransferase-like selenium metabolism protein YedF [Promicromonosporaceae bacterium]
MNPLNLIGRPCPLPVIEAKKALRTAGPGQSIGLLVDNDLAGQNLGKLAAGLGHAVSFEAAGDGHILVTITVRDDPAGPALRPARALEGGGLVVVIGHEALGGGPGPELGPALMKAFLHSLTELDQAPEHLLFLNGGAFLTTEGSSALEDIQLLEDRGAVVGTCGACLDFYQLAGKLKVGSVTNIYAIAAALAQAGKIINF